MDTNATAPTSEKRPVSPVWDKIKQFLKKLWKNFIWPALQDLLAGIISKTTNQVIYHVPPDARQQSTYTPQYNRSTQTYASRPSAAAPARPSVYKTAGADVNVDYLTSGDRSLLANILEKARRELQTKGSLSLSDLYFAAGLSSDPPDCTVGWTDISEFRIEFNTRSNDYTMVLPTVSQL